MDAITFFGLISILDSVLSIYAALSAGTMGVFRLFLICVAAFAVIFAAVILFVRHYR